MAKRTILDTKNLVPDRSKSKIFLGNFSGFQRFDSPKYKFFTSMEEKQRNAFWNPNEISMANDAQKFFELPKHIQEVMIRIWLFQTLMDSAQNSGLEEVLAAIATNEEAQAMFKTQGYFELIHSLSYSHILRGIFADSSKIFDKISEYPEIQKRVNKEIALYEKVKNIDNIKDETEKKKIILELLVSILALEGIKFNVSFLFTYIINNSYGNKIQGASRIIKLINFDEDLHTSMVSGTIQILRRSPDEGFAELIKSQWFTDMATKVFTDVLKDELEFADYLLSFGDIPTLTKGVIEQFMKYYVDDRLASIGVAKPYGQEKTDVVQWYESYKDINKDNVAQQEAEGTAYSIGIMVEDMPEDVVHSFIPDNRKDIFKYISRPSINNVNIEAQKLIDEDCKEQ